MNPNHKMKLKKYKVIQILKLKVNNNNSKWKVSEILLNIN